MATDNPKSALLAHWHFTNEQWREFLYYEKLDSESRKLVDLKAVLTGGIVIITLIAFFGAVKGGPGVFVLVVALGFSFIGLCYLIDRIIRLSNERKLRTLTGEVKIVDGQVIVNGVIYEWRGLSRPEIYKDYIYLGEEKMPLLVFNCTRWITVKGGREKIEKKWLVPVPPGKEAEADIVISEITENYFKFKK